LVDDWWLCDDGDGGSDVWRILAISVDFTLVSPSRCKELLESDDKSILGFTVFSFRSGR
jgi:hypothetical protein